MTRALSCLLVAVLVSLGCSETETFSPRMAVGTMAKGFETHRVSSAADAAAYADAYARALGVDGVHAARVLGFGNVYWVYVAEDHSGRWAFSLGVRAGGEIGVRHFPAPDPEMMWNQKYGHSARFRPSAIEEDVSRAKAVEAVRGAVRKDVGIRPGEALAYYGYFLFPLCEGRRLVGEAAVNSAHGDVVWKRLPGPVLSAWAAPGTAEDPCD